MSALKLLLVISILSSSQVSSDERSIPITESTETGTVVEPEKAVHNETVGIATDLDLELKIDDKLHKYKWPDAEFIDDFFGFEHKYYVASLRLEELLGYDSENRNSSPGRGSVLIGIRRPSYRLVGNPHVNGIIDLQMGASIFGLRNSGLISISYYLKSDDTYSHVSTTLSLVSFSYRFIIPLSLK